MWRSRSRRGHDGSAQTHGRCLLVVAGVVGPAPPRLRDGATEEARRRAPGHGHGHGHHRGHGFPPNVDRFNLAGYKLETTYTLGRNTGNAFEQTYTGTTVQGVPVEGPFVGMTFPPAKYVALPIARKTLYVVWLNRCDPRDHRRVRHELQNRCGLRLRAGRPAARELGNRADPPEGPDAPSVAHAVRDGRPRAGRPPIMRSPGARSSVGERSLHTREVAGSKPAAPTSRKPRPVGAFSFRRTTAPQSAMGFWKRPGSGTALEDPGGGEEIAAGDGRSPRPAQIIQALRAAGAARGDGRRTPTSGCSRWHPPPR